MWQRDLGFNEAVRVLLGEHAPGEARKLAEPKPPKTREAGDDGDICTRAIKKLKEIHTATHPLANLAPKRKSAKEHPGRDQGVSGSAGGTRAASDGGCPVEIPV